MTKYTIEHKETGRIICKTKGGGRHYRQGIDNIEKGLEIVKTTRGRAQRECDFLNNKYDYLKGWQIYEVKDDKRRNQK